MKKYICAMLACFACTAAVVTLLPENYARQQNTVVWNTQLLLDGEATADEPVHGLLAYGGQTVFLSKDEPYEIELDTECEITADGLNAQITKADENKYILTIEKNEEIQETEETEKNEEETNKPFVTVTSGERSATFVYVSDSETSDDENVTDNNFNVTSQFNEKLPIGVTAGDAPVMLTGLPEKTRYTVDSMSYVLYDGGNIKLAAKAVCKIDLSIAGIKDDIILTSGEHSETVRYVPLPTYKEDGIPIFLSDTVSLPVEYRWGEIEPTVKIFRLVKGEDAITWEADTSVTAGSSDEGKLLLMANGAAAGTYKAEVDWHGNEAMDITFYIRYSNIG